MYAIRMDFGLKRQLKNKEAPIGPEFCAGHAGDSQTFNWSKDISKAKQFPSAVEAVQYALRWWGTPGLEAYFNTLEVVDVDTKEVVAHGVSHPIHAEEKGKRRDPGAEEAV
jgi:hypothetical protein